MDRWRQVQHGGLAAQLVRGRRRRRRRRNLFDSNKKYNYNW